MKDTSKNGAGQGVKDKKIQHASCPRQARRINVSSTFVAFDTDTKLVPTFAFGSGLATWPADSRWTWQAA